MLVRLPAKPCPKANSQFKLPANWRSRLEIVRIPETWHTWDKAQYLLQFQLGRVPVGLQEEVGYLVYHLAWPYFIDDVLVDERLRGRGLGRQLYEYVLEQNGMLSTRYHYATDAAQAVWRGLLLKYPSRVEFFEPRLSVFWDENSMQTLDKKPQEARMVT